MRLSSDILAAVRGTVVVAALATGCSVAGSPSDKSQEPTMGEYRDGKTVALRAQELEEERRRIEAIEAACGRG